MRIIDRFTSEHDVFLQQLATIDELKRGEADDGALIAAVRTLSTPLLRHAESEESALFPDIAAQIGAEGGPLGVLTAEHVVIHGYLERIAGRPTRPELVAVLDALASLLRGHIEREEVVLFPLADRIIGDERLRELDREATAGLAHVAH